jgi:predicted HTH transcriptional regulator
MAKNKISALLKQGEGLKVEFKESKTKQFTPYAKNPSISKLMLQIGRVEEVGSGIRNLDKYLLLFSKGATYELIDEEFFSTVVYLGKKSQEGKSNITLNITRKILEIIKENPQVSIKQAKRAKYFKANWSRQGRILEDYQK